MVHELKEWFNVKCNLNPDQEALTAELILDDVCFYDLTLGNIKACFRQHMKDATLYDRLDGNIIIGWLREFKSDMADWCESTHIREEVEDSSPDAISHAAYMAMLESRANDGDREARKILDNYQERTRIPSPEQMRRKEFEQTLHEELYRKDRDKYLKDARK